MPDTPALIPSIHPPGYRWRVTEDREIYIALVLVGSLPVTATLMRGGAVGAGITLCFLMIGVGMFGLVSGAWRARRVRVPIARVVDRSSTAQTR